MNKINFFIVVVVALSVFAGCGPKSEKGKWTDADKTAFKTGFVEELKKGNSGLAEDLITKVADCALTRIEAEFSVEGAGAPENTDKIGEIVKGCITENQPAPAETTAPATEEPTDSTKTAEGGN